MKALCKTLLFLFFPIIAFAQINEAEVYKSKPLAIKKDNWDWSRYGSVASYDGKKHGYGQHYDNLIYYDFDKNGEPVNAKVITDFFKGRASNRHYVIKDEVLFIWAETNKVDVTLKCQRLNLATKFITDERVLSVDPEVDFKMYDINLTPQNKLYVFMYGKTDKEGQAKTKYILFDKSLTLLAKVEKKIKLDTYYTIPNQFKNNFFRSISIDNSNQMYLVVEQKKDDDRVLEVIRFSPDGTCKRIKFETQGMNLPNVFIKQFKDGETYMAGFGSFPKKKIASEVALWKLDEVNSTFVLESRQPLNLFKEKDDGKLKQYMVDFFPGTPVVPIRHEFIPKDILKMADGSKIILGRGFGLTQITPGSSDATEAQPGFVCCKISKENKLAWVNDFSTQYYYDYNNSLAIEKNGNIYVLYPYHKGVYKYASVNSIYPPNELRLAKISEDGTLTEQVLEVSIEDTGILQITPEKEFVIKLYAVENKKSTCTFYDKDKETFYYQVKIK